MSDPWENIAAWTIASNLDFGTQKSLNNIESEIFTKKSVRVWLHSIHILPKA